jgi:hypothetical protein
MLHEKFAELLVEQDTVGVDPQVKEGNIAQRGLKFGDHPPEPGQTGEQRFPAMQNDLDRAKSARGRMFSDTLRRPRDDLIRDDNGPPAPALVGSLIDVAMITRKITAAV